VALKGGAFALPKSAFSETGASNICYVALLQCSLWLHPCVVVFPHTERYVLTLPGIAS
jgi:hypothetical protein